MSLSSRNPLIACGAALLLAAGASGAATAAELQVTLQEIRTAAGFINVAVVASQDAWDGKAKPAGAQRVAPTVGNARVAFADLPPGRYAVMVSHDENGNGKLDTNLIGMPTEGYGFSNNPRVMRKPTWDEAVFELGADGAAIVVQLR